MDCVANSHPRKMADRKKKHHAEPEEQENVAETEVQLLMKCMMEENKRAEARREAESKRAEARVIAAEERTEIRRREERVAEEERLEARRLREKIAEEERVEARRVAAEEREEKRAEAKRIRKLEEERKLEEREAAREEAAKQASEALRELQEAANVRAYEQQVALVKLQSEIGDKTTEAHRVEQASNRKKERAIASVGVLREQEDMEDFLATSERKLKAGGVPEEEWLAVIASKLSGKVGSTWQDLSTDKENYHEVKAGLLKVCGYTPKLAGELFYGFKADSLKGVSADQLYARGVQLVRRMVAPYKLAPEVEFLLVKPWVWSVVPKRARQVLDARAVTTAEELLGALQDFLVVEGERKEGQAAVFGKQNYSEGCRITPLVCFSCGKTGHKAADCWGSSNASPYQPGSVAGSAGPQIVCYTCGEPGHRSTQCPNKDKNGRGVKPGRAEPKELPRQVNRLRGHPSRDTILEMSVNGQNVPVLLDSGSAITVVPERMVAQSQILEETVELRGFGAKDSFVLQLAEIPFEIDRLSWKEIVALAPAEAGGEVVYGLNLVSSRGLELVYLANRRKLDEEERSRAAGIDTLVADRPASGSAPAVRKEEEGVEQEEEVGFGTEQEEEEEKEEEVEIVYEMRRLEVINYSMSDLGVVGGDRKQLEAPQQSSYVSEFNVDYDFVCSSDSEEEEGGSTGSILQLRRVSPHRRKLNNEKELREQPVETVKEPRTAPFLVVGGDVGTAHRRRDREKEKEESKEE